MLMSVAAVGAQYFCLIAFVDIVLSTKRYQRTPVKDELS